MPPLCHLSPLDPLYPTRLRRLATPPATLTVCGGSLEAPCVVAVVGSREAHPEAASFARSLAATLARAGAVVASGGAVGIDAVAHLGALDVGGRTWCVAGTGADHCFPPEHAALFDRIARGPGAMLWPFPPDRPARAGSFLARNRVLVALSDALVVVQAGARSGALNAAAAARRLGRPLWVVPPPPWLLGSFLGSKQLLQAGARPLFDSADLLSSLGLAPRLESTPRLEGAGGGPGERPRSPGAASVAPSCASGAAEPRERGGGASAHGPVRTMDETETKCLAQLGRTPLHLDEISQRAHLPPQAVAAALLTMALEAVVVEGPPGFFSRPRRP